MYREKVSGVSQMLKFLPSKDPAKYFLPKVHFQLLIRKISIENATHYSMSLPWFRYNLGLAQLALKTHRVSKYVNGMSKLSFSKGVL
jgi:hypothetical protein